MVEVRSSLTLRTIPVLLVVCLFNVSARAKYSGGTGEPNDPYQIATAADLIALGETPEDYDKHFILTADIDLDPNLPGRKVFDKAVIAPDTDPNDQYSQFQGTFFSGVFDGSSHKISHLIITGDDYVGLFGRLASGAEVKNLALVDVNITGSGGNVAGLVGYNHGDVTRCYSSGTVRGSGSVGGLVGCNYAGYITDCYSTCAVTGVDSVGGLVGADDFDVEPTGGALIMGSVSRCYSTGIVVGNTSVGGLVGKNCLGFEGAEIRCTEVVGCFWDMETSGQATSASGTGKTTAEMKMAGTFVGWWYGSIWTIDEGKDYPRLRWENAPGETIRPFYYSGGAGTSDDPYLIYTGAQLNAIGLLVCDWDKHFKLIADIDLSAHTGTAFNMIGAPDMPFTGVLDGNAHTISRLTLTGGSYLGLFRQLDWGAEVRNLGVVDVNIVGSSDYVGGLVGYNRGGVVTSCYSTGVVRGGSDVGGLVGYNEGTVIRCYSTATVGGDSLYVGGLVGYNWYGDLNQCYSTGTVNGNHYVGGLVGVNEGNMNDCYSTGTASSGSNVGGLAGRNYGNVTHCYSTGKVYGWESLCAGGHVGLRWSGSVTDCFWDIQTSRQTDSSAGTGRTTAEMQAVKTFLDAGWDFVGETANGSEDIWKIAEGLGYPRLSWEKYSGGSGTADDPYRVGTPSDLIALGETPEDYDKHFILTADIDLDPNLPGRKVFDRAVIAPDLVPHEWDWDVPHFAGTPFTGVFDGNDHTISHLTIKGGSYLGLFGLLESRAEIKDLGIVDIRVTDSNSSVGGLIGENGFGNVTRCYCTGLVSGTERVGGLVGMNGWGRVTQCYSTVTVVGDDQVGGLVGENTITGAWGVCGGGTITNCYSSGSVRGDSYVAGLVGLNGGTLTHCYSTGVVSGSDDVGGLVVNVRWGTESYGGGGGTANDCFCDTQTSGQTTNDGGTGKTTAEMQTAKTFLDAGWDFVGETANGSEDIWWILEGKDYPRLWWEAAEE